MLIGRQAEDIQKALDAIDSANVRRSAVNRGAIDDVKQSTRARRFRVPKRRLAANGADLHSAQSEVDTVIAGVNPAMAALDSANAGRLPSAIRTVEQLLTALTARFD